MPIYEKPVHQLMKDMVKELGLEKGQKLSRAEVKSWFKLNYPRIKDGTISAHLLRMSTNAPSRIHYGIDPSGADDLLFQIDGSHFRLYEPEKDSSPIYEKVERDEIVDDTIEPEDEIRTEFAYERDLKNFLTKNLHLIEPGLTLYEEEDVTGVEFPAGNRFIDILALDASNNYVIIELKVSRGYDRVVGQLLRYVAWIEKYHADPNQKVRGIIVAKDISDDLLLAASKISDVKLFEYELSVTLHKIP